MRVLGLDYGSKTVGVAITDPLGLSAQPLETIVRKEENKLRRTLARLEEICRAYEVERIILGLPLNMDGSEGERAQMTRVFAEKLISRTQLPLEYEDERLTTMEAEEILREAGVPVKNRKQHLDQMAASLILRSWLEKEEYRGKNHI